MYPAELEIKDTTESTTYASYLDLLLSIGRDGQLHSSIYDKRDDFNFHITNSPFLSSNIPSSPAYGVLSLNLYDTPGLAPRINVLFRGPRDFPVSYSNRDTSWNAWNRHSGSFMVDTGILFSNIKFPSHDVKDFLTLDQLWLPNQSGFPPMSWIWYRLWPSPNYEWFPWSICNGSGMPAGNAYPSGHLVPSPHFGTCLCSNCWDQIPRTCRDFTRLFTSNAPWYFLDFALPFWHFCCCRGFCHRAESDLFLFVFVMKHCTVWDGS